jgi:beta-lactamase regulating signal transducer with metallopeptidase domain
MNALSTSLLMWFSTATIHLLLLVALVMGAERLFRHRLPAAWRHALWALALVPLLCPILPPCPWSPLNLLRVRQASGSGLPAAVWTASLSPVAAVPDQALPPAVGSPGAPARQVGTAWLTLPNVLISLWLLGAILLFVRHLSAATAFRRRVREGHAIDDADLLAELAACSAALGLRRRVRVVETEAVASPALMGLFRPTILVPPGLMGRLSLEERQCVLFHELAHVRRYDLATDSLCGVLQLVHWFNPAVLLVAARLRTTREAACDAHVLESRPAEVESLRYAHTLLKLAADARPISALPALAGMAERTSGLEARLVSITDFRPSRRRHHVLGLSMVVLIALVGLSRGLEPAAPPAVGKEAKNPASTPVAAAADGKPSPEQITVSARFLEVRGDSPKQVKKMLALLAPPLAARLKAPGLDMAEGIVLSAVDTKKLQARRERLSGRLRLDVLSAPRVTTVHGETATLRMVEERYFPTGWEQGIDEKTGKAVAVPVFKDATDIGAILRVAPRLADGPGAIDLDLVARVVEHRGWLKETLHVVGHPETELPAPMPIIVTRQAKKRLVIPRGGSACLVTNIVSDKDKWEDKVPIAGDLPFIGQAFRKRGEKTVFKGLLVVVTAQHVNKDGLPR